MKYITPLFDAIKRCCRSTASSVKGYYRCLRLKRKRRQHARRLKSQTLPYTHCKNCGHELKGMYCHACGQYARDINPSIFDFVWQYFENAFQFDGKAWLTLRRLFINPGRLSAEFMAGHIRRYVFPLKLYMAVAVIFSFAVLGVRSIGGGAVQDQKVIPDSVVVAQGNNAQTINSAIQAKITWKLEDTIAKKQQINEVEKSTSNDPFEELVESSAINFAGRIPIIMMFAMPFFALFSRLFFRRRYKKYLPHLIFAIHLHTVLFISVMVVMLLSIWKTLFVSWAIVAVILWLIIYGIVAAIRFYGDSLWLVILKNTGLYLLYYVFCFIIAFLGFFINLGYDSWAAGGGFLDPITKIFQ